MALRTLVLIGFAAAGIVVAGCSGDDSAPSNPATGDPTGAPTGSAPPTATPDAGDAGPRPLGPPQTGGVLLDAHGGLHPFGGAKVDTTGAPTWTDDLARALVVLSDGSGGWVLDGHGAIHEFGAAPKIASPKVDAMSDWARALVVLDDRASGYLLDAHGAVTPFGGAPSIAGAPTLARISRAASTSTATRAASPTARGCSTGGEAFTRWAPRRISARSRIGRNTTSGTSSTSSKTAPGRLAVTESCSRLASRPACH